VSQPVVVVGPAAVCGPGAVPAELASVALDAIDDRLTVHADRVVTVRDLWGEVMRTALAGERNSAVLVVPSWWPRARVELVEAATRESCAQVLVQPRGRVTRSEAPDVVELGPDCVVVHSVKEGRRVLRTRAPESVAEDVLAGLPAATSVIVEVPDGVPECALVAAELTRGMRRRGSSVTALDDDGLRRATLAGHRPRVAGRSSRVGRSDVEKRRVAVFVGALVVIGALAAAALAPGPQGPRQDAVAWVLEGRVAVELPAHWPVQRVMSGPGSARVQAVSPSEPRVAVHVTQARVRTQETLQQTADVLRAALEQQPNGLFVDFDPRAERAGRAAVTYRELRAVSAVDWVVLLDGAVRIAIGCQHPVERPEFDAACERAVRSAHAVS
jgi:type VII secretion-associated protein (TIGR03931 family)